LAAHGKLVVPGLAPVGRVFVRARLFCHRMGHPPCERDDMRICSLTRNHQPVGDGVGKGWKMFLPLLGERAGVRADVFSRSRLLLVFACLLFTALSSPADDTNTSSKPSVIIVVGAPGEEEFGKKFEEWAGLWQKAAEKNGVKAA